MSDINITVNSGQSKRLLVAGTLPRKNIVVTGVGGESAKLQHKTVTVTENKIIDIVPDSGYNGLSKTTVNIKVPTKDCSGNHVIEVDTLPTEDIDENAVYLCDGAYYKYLNEFTDIYIAMPGGDSLYSIKENNEGKELSFNIIPTKTADGILESDEETKFHPYYIADEDGVFLYLEGQWQDTGCTVVSDVSEIPDLTTITKMTYYAVVKFGWEKYFAPKGELTITENGTHDIAEYASVNVNVPIGGGECDKPHIIEVDELPTDNIDENALYLCKGAYYKPTGFGDIVDVFAIIDAEHSGLLTQYYADLGTTVRFDIIPTRNSDVSAPADDEVLWCFIEDENAILGYAGEYGWLPISVILGAELPFGGFITDTSEATEPGYYALMTRGWTKYLNPTGTLEITESGTYDVSEYASAEVNVSPTLQEKTVTENGEIIADEGYDGLSKVTVNVPGEVVEEYDGTIIIE